MVYLASMDQFKNLVHLNYDSEDLQMIDVVDESLLILKIQTDYYFNP